MIKKITERANFPQILIAVLAALLIVAGVILFNASGRASHAAQMEKQQLLEAAMSNFQTEFTRLTLDLTSNFGMTPRYFTDWQEVDSFLLERYDDWENSSRNQRMIDAISLGLIDDRGELSYRRYNVGDPQRQFNSTLWPQELELLQKYLINYYEEDRRRPPLRHNEIMFVLIDNQPVVMLPILKTENRESMPPPRDSESPNNRSRRHPPAKLVGFSLLTLNDQVLKEQWLTDLFNSTIRGQELNNFQFAIVTGRQLQCIFKAPTNAPEFNNISLDNIELKDVNAALDLLRPNLNLLLEQREPPPPPPPPKPNGVDRNEGRRPRPPVARPQLPMLDRNNLVYVPESWNLIARHHDGSLRSLVRMTRIRILVIAYSLLILIFTSVTMLVLTAQRSQALAKQQLEFVAGVSHELRTPLSVIQSAGFNLASGRINDQTKVQNYGSLIQKEGKRLATMIEQMLSYAGIQSGKQRYDFQLLSINEVIEQALAEYQPLFREAGWQLDQQIDNSLPEIVADRVSLESVIKNLFQNALKYATDGKWLAISANRVNRRGTEQVVITVADRGPGIAKEDISRIFDPFYRGKGVSSSLPGAGLGLSLLKRHIDAHNGNVTVENSAAGGAIFKIYLPVNHKLLKA